MFIVPFFYLYYKVMILIIIYFLSMYNSLFNVSAQEYNRIIESHKLATKKHYILKEQKVDENEP